MGQPFFLGGQAVIEGVMMRSPAAVAIAVRRANGEIVVRRESVRSLLTRYRFLDKPFVRGVFALFDALVLGMRSLNYSAEVALQDESLKNPAGDDGGKPAKKRRQERRRGAVSDVANMGGAIAATVGVAFLLGIGLFVVLPNLIADWITPLRDSPVHLNVAEGVIRLLIFLLYVVAIGSLKDIRRVFEYHGAEHKVVWTVERGEPLTVEAARGFPTAHPRCGTSFVFIVIFVSIVFFAFLGWDTSLVVRILSRIALLPMIAGVSYEFIRLAASHSCTAWSRALLAPGLALQRLTTRNPKDDQIEVAIKAMEAVLGAAETPEPVVLPRRLTADLVPVQ